MFRCGACGRRGNTRGICEECRELLVRESGDSVRGREKFYESEERLRRIEEYAERAARGEGIFVDLPGE